MSGENRSPGSDTPETVVGAPATLIVLTEDGEIRRRCRSSLDQLRADSHVPQTLDRYLSGIVFTDSEAKTIRELDAALTDPAAPRAIVVSDLLANHPSDPCCLDPEPTSWAETIRRRYENKLLALVAITGWAPRRPPDIDRVVDLHVAPESLIEALELAARALDYKAPPQPTQLEYPIEVRRIRRANELLEYYQLRYNVYNLMGYLDWKLEARGSGIEADWRDLNSVHIAAFERRRPNQYHVVGTARIILARSPDSNVGVLNLSLLESTSSLANQDPVLRSRFRPPFSNLSLPVWHSQPVYDKIVDMFQRRERHGEISRVIVDEGHRGASLSRVMMAYALQLAYDLPLDLLFLECVPLHGSLYRKFGFRELPGTHQRVVNVDKTVIAMECQPKCAVEGEEGLPGESARRVISEQCYLCCCQHRECYCGDYALYNTAKCPLKPRPRPR